ncbi:hypothetical protein INT47_008321 [Mucor saturninus]|uniref:Uncharacterized protein n=1 Tax=Mucor saturninus TaxID=64648 RepID=A0A8H7RF45_9FUNG|nr:hypothetical protein INT47_008321 [Mucor saturninus]
MCSCKYLPREIWDIIIIYTADIVEDHRTMAVNKHWYSLFLSIAFASAIIRLDWDCSKFYNIVNSPFCPGQWTTSITFRSFKEEELSAADAIHDKLYRLMIHTPHVEQVKFILINLTNAQEWDYFYKVLKMADVWKLRRLPDDWKLESMRDNRMNMKLIYSTYLKCARHVKYSLDSIRLIQETMPTDIDLSFLNEFTVLSYLNIGKGILKNVYDMDTILQYTPQLRELEVDFATTSFRSDNYNNRPILNGVYPSIHTLNFHHFVFETNNQIGMFHTSFKGLESLKIGCVNHRPRITLALDTDTVRNFFTMLTSLVDYNIRFHENDVSMSDFLSRNCQQEMHARIFSSHQYSESIAFGKTRLIANPLINFNFGADQFTDNDYSVENRILSNFSQNIKQLEFYHWETEKIRVYLTAVFSTRNEGLCSIVFKEVIFDNIFTADTTYTSNIKNMTFDMCEISKQSLYSLSSRFTTLDSISFKDCHFDGSFVNPWLYLTMPKTKVHRLCISYNVKFNTTYYGTADPRFLDKDKLKTKPHSFPLVSLTLTGQNVKRYYYTRNDTIPVIVETSKTRFDLLTKTVQYGLFTKIICVKVKSIRELSLKLCKDRSKDMELIF